MQDILTSVLIVLFYQLQIIKSYPADEKILSALDEIFYYVENNEDYNLDYNC